LVSGASLSIFYCTQGKLARSVNTECGTSVIRDSEETPFVIMTIGQIYIYADMKPPVLLNFFTGDYKCIIYETSNSSGFHDGMHCSVVFTIYCR
jgi:hypothetical protein